MKRLLERRALCVSLVLAVVTLALYWPATKYHFIDMDDGDYIYNNPWVQNGLSWSGIKWAFTTMQVANWHPLVWISWMLDYSMYGLFAGGYHLTNILFHTINTVLLFVLLKRMTSRLWLSGAVAALFAWHPLHVESVAWIAERKDVLSTFFLILTLLSYSRYVEKPALARYLLTLVLFALGLMAKPMLVTLPCLLLLLDYWPLNRTALYSASAGQAPPRRILGLITEKLPFFALSLASCAITIWAQRGGAIKSAEDVPYSLRLLNTVVAYAKYLSKTVWPVHLCAYYPLPAHVSIVTAIFAALLLIAITYLALRWHSRLPWVVVGWFWFLCTLIPVIGLIQVGKQELADRYTYIPLIGIFIGGVWAGDYWLGHRTNGGALKAGAIIAILLPCLIATRVQLGYWEDSIVLFQRALSVTSDNPVAENNLGVALANAGRNAEAIVCYKNVVRLHPNNVNANYNLGIQCASQNKPAEAEYYYLRALSVDPKSEKLHNNLGAVLAQQGKLDSAIDHFKKAIELNGTYPNPYYNLGVALQQQGFAGAAATNYIKALQLNPQWPEVLDQFAFLLATTKEDQWHNPAEAVKLAQRANELTGGKSFALLDTLALCYAANGDFSNATVTLDNARAHASPDDIKSFGDYFATEQEAFKNGRMPSVSSTNVARFIPQH